jgi:putative FmdB family regulatory protein
MPIYEYECSKCGRIDEMLQKFSDKPLKKCKHCSGKLNKLISHSSFHLKGTGWYVTDYGNKSRNSATPPGNRGGVTNSDTNKSESKTNTNKSESKTEESNKTTDKTS